MAFRLFHGLKVVRSVHLTQIDGLIGSCLRNTTGDCKSFAEWHRSHVFTTRCVPITKATWRADQVFHTFLRGRWSSTSTAGCDCLTGVIRGQYHVLYVSACVTLTIPQAVVTTSMRRLLCAVLRFLIGSWVLLVSIVTLWCFGRLRSDLMLCELLLPSSISGTDWAGLI